MKGRFFLRLSSRVTLMALVLVLGAAALFVNVSGRYQREAFLAEHGAELDERLGKR